MLELTEQQWQAVQEQAGAAVEVIDPNTQCAYVFLAREQYERMRFLAASEREPNTPGTEDDLGILPGILRSQEAFWRDLPDLLSQRKLR